MPVTFTPAKHASEAFDSNKFPRHSANQNTGLAVRVLEEACYQQYKQLDELLQSSFDDIPLEEERERPIVPQRNGFVDTVLAAYNNHHALIIRPDDVWVAILVQFSSFINGNAEQVRSQFVQHKGKKELTVKADRRDVDYAKVANMLTMEIEKNVVDPSLRSWILPNFSTTTANDTAVCSVVMMASMKKYFDYKIFLMCGIPRVTLEGEKQDWEKILKRLEKLKEYGLQTITWYHLLRPVVARFVKAFDAPDDQANLDFWQRVAHYEGGGSGPTYLCGWITAFCVFNDEGQWMGDQIKANVTESADAPSLPCKDFFSSYIDIAPLPDELTYFSQTPDERATLKLDDAQYHILDTSNIPCGYSEVDVLLDDDGIEYKCMMVAGAVAMRFRSTEVAGAGVKDTVEPVAGWWMFTKKSEEEVQAEEHEQHNALFPGLAAMEDQVDNSTDNVEGPEGKKEEKISQVSDSRGAGCCNCVVM